MPVITRKTSLADMDGRESAIDIGKEIGNESEQAKLSRVR